MDPLKSNEQLISSSRIRTLISEEILLKANKMLFKSFVISGRVILGKQLGRTLGYPTANIDIDEKFIIPNAGVYYTVVR